MVDSSLPQVLAEIAALIGPEAAWTLVRQFGGRTIYIPALMKPDHALAQAIGLETATALSEHFRDPTADFGFIGRKVLIPMATNARCMGDWREILETGKLSEIAEAMGVHERTALRRRNKFRAQSVSKQGSLF